MRTPISQSLGAAGFAPWIPLNRYQVPQNTSLALEFSTDKNLTAGVQYTLDDLWQEFTNFTAARSGTTVTVTMTNHGLKAGDWVYMKNAGGQFDGTFEVATAADANTFTYTVSNTGITAAGPNATLQKARVFDHSVLTGLTDDAVSNFSAPVVACRLEVTAYTAGRVTLTVNQGMGH